MTKATATATELSLAQGNDDAWVGGELRQLARQCVAESADHCIARGLMIGRVLQREEVTRYLIAEACASLIAAADQQTRQALTRAAYEPSPAAGARIAARLRNRGSAYDWPLPGGKRLGDATLAEVDAAAERHKGQKEGAASRERFYRAIAKRLRGAGGKGIVREVLRDHEIDQLLTESIT